MNQEEHPSFQSLAESSLPFTIPALPKTEEKTQTCSWWQNFFSLKKKEDMMEVAGSTFLAQEKRYGQSEGIGLGTNVTLAFGILNQCFETETEEFMRCSASLHSVVVGVAMKSHSPTFWKRFLTPTQLFPKLRRNSKLLSGVKIQARGKMQQKRKKKGMMKVEKH